MRIGSCYMVFQKLIRVLPDRQNVVINIFTGSQHYGGVNLQVMASVLFTMMSMRTVCVRPLPSCRAGL